MKLTILLLICISALLSCTSIERKSESVWLEPSVRIHLPEESCPYDYEKDELLTWQKDGDKHSLRVETSCKNQVLEIIGLLPSGPRLFTAKKEGKNVEVLSELGFKLPLSPTQVTWNILFATLKNSQIISVLPNGYFLEDKDN
ncbi:MAG: DUF3261 domain-containing protein, partial [Burkholderiales bacterium]|nr:DUF3261 domain-containing protein [Burkholderiales bacterium]